jgi:hypothetical protein
MIVIIEVLFGRIREKIVGYDESYQ